MPSPFPGMNPYLERAAVWHDFHETLIPMLREALAAQVRPHYFVKIDEHIYVHELSEEPPRFLGRADINVTATGRPGGPGTTATLAEPAQVELLDVDVEGLSYLEIRDRDTGQVVTVIEVLSPANKYAGTNREQHLAKRRQLFSSAVHVVEIDLLRGGPRMPFVALPPLDYYVLVSRSETRPRAGLWPIRLRDPLPTIPVPLRAPHPDATLDLQALLHRVYDAAGYEDYLYRGEPEPRLNAEDAAWARALVPSPS